MDAERHSAYTRLAGVASACMVGLILTAGLWPFHVPHNRVYWLSANSGLKFGGHGSAVSRGSIQARHSVNSSGTLEILLEPASSEASGTILGFDASEHPGEPLSLHQRQDALVIRRNNVDPKGISRTALIIVGDVFRRGVPVLITASLDERGTAVYINGVLKNWSPLSRTWNDLTGRIVLANSPTVDDSWSGTIRGLAIYPQPLTGRRARLDYMWWTGREKLAIPTESQADALYLFDEGNGVVVHNRMNQATDLIIPASYFVLHPTFLRAPWSGYHALWSYWQDVIVNIVGFIPFGFCVCAYLWLKQPARYPGWTVVALGTLTSLTIEVLQRFLPTRLSDATDVITNTLGTVIGAIACRMIGKLLQLPRPKEGGRESEIVVAPVTST